MHVFSATISATPSGLNYFLPVDRVSHSDPSSPLLSVTSIFFLQSDRLVVSCRKHRFFCRPRLRRPLTSAAIILFIPTTLSTNEDTRLHNKSDILLIRRLRVTFHYASPPSCVFVHIL